MPSPVSKKGFAFPGEVFVQADYRSSSFEKEKKANPAFLFPSEHLRRPFSLFGAQPGLDRDISPRAGIVWNESNTILRSDKGEGLSDLSFH